MSTSAPNVTSTVADLAIRPPRAHGPGGAAARLVGTWVLAALILLVSATSARAVGPVEGFGTDRSACASMLPYTVTNLDNAGTGSLREAVSGSNRLVQFMSGLGGEIVLTDPTGLPSSHANYDPNIYVKGSCIAIEGPAEEGGPRITLVGGGLIIRGNVGLPSNLTPASNVTVRNLRIRSVPDDAVQVAYGAHNVLIEHLSVWGAADGLIDITERAHDVTVAWNILAGAAKAMLIKYNASRVTLRNNIFVGGRNRNPQVSADDAGTPATDTTLDMVNNLVYDWKAGAGTAIHHGARANVVANFYSSPNDLVSDQEQALIVCQSGVCFNTDNASDARAYTDGNVSGDFLDIDINDAGTENEPFPAPAVTTDDACTAARLTLDHAGVRPLDAKDREYLDPITLPICRRTATVLTAAEDSPTLLGAPVTFTATVDPMPPASGLVSGSVTFFKGTAAMATVPLVDGVATLVTSALPQGTTTVKAVYSGDLNFDASQTTLKHAVVGSPTSTTLVAAPTPAYVGTLVTLTATVTAPPPSTAIPEGSVRFYNGTKLLATRPLLGGQATFETSALPPGYRTMKAQFLGESGFAGSTSPALSVQIDGGSVTSLTRTPSTADFGQTVKFTAKVSPVTVGSPSGTVTFRDGTALLGTRDLVGGTAIFTTSDLSVGKHLVTATYNGNPDILEKSVSAAVSTNVVKGATKTTLTVTPLSLLPNATVKLTAVVTPVAPATGVPGGSVKFKDGSALLATVPLSGGRAEITIPGGALGLGASSVFVTYGGSAEFQTSSSKKITVTVNP
jgi:pectate lyase